MKDFEDYLDKMGYSWNDFDRTYEMQNLIEQYADEKTNQALSISDVRKSLPDAEQCLKIQEQVKQYCYIDQNENPVISSGGIKAIISRWKQMIAQ